MYSIRTVLRLVFISFLFSFISACSSGGGDGGGRSTYAISLSQSSVSAQVNIDGIETVSVTATYRGDGIVIGSPPGIPEVNWLAVSIVPAGAQARLDVSMLGNVSPGRYTTTLRFITGKADGSAVVYEDLSITMHVAGQPFLIGDSGKSINVNSRANELVWDLKLISSHGAIGSSVTWTATSNRDWLTITNTNGDMNGSKVLHPLLDPEALLKLPNGAHYAKVTVQFSDPEIFPLSQYLKVDLQLTPELTLAEPAMFSIDDSSEDAALTAGVAVISDDIGSAFAPYLGDVRWHAQTDQDWLTVETPNGDIKENSQLILKLDRAALAFLANGEHEASVTLVPDIALFPSATVPVTLELALPSLAGVGPYVAFRGKDNQLILQGSGFKSDLSHTVTLDDAGISTEFLSQTQLSLQVPSNMAAGEYTLTTTNSLGIERPKLRLLVKDSPIYSLAAVAIPTGFRNITLDPERQAVLLTGWPSNQLYRLALNEEGQWHGNSFAMPNLQTATLTSDGSEVLVAVASTDINDRILRLNADTFAINDNSSSPLVHDFYTNYDLVLPMLDGSTFVFNSDQRTAALSYPDWQYLGPLFSVHGARAVMSRDRTRFLLGGVNSATDTYSYSVDEGAFVHRPALLSDFFRPTSISMSSNASRIVTASSVYDSNYQLLGSLTPFEGIDGVAVTPDGKSAFVKRFVGAQTLVFRYDISAAVGPYPANVEPLDLALAEQEYIVDMRVSDDGGALFILSAKSEFGFIYPTQSVLYVYPLVD